MTEPNVPLPKAPILGYLSNITTPTRVRILAARGVFGVGILFFALSAVLFVWLANRFMYSYTHRWGGGGGILNGISYVFNYHPEYLVYFFLVLAFLFMPALTLVGFAAAVRRGRQGPSVIATICLLPFTLALLIATAIFLGTIFLDIFDTRRYPHFSYALWLLLTPISVVVVLLIKDLCGFLIWIARNPAVEKPPTPFLPTAGPPTLQR
jgi:hypothetical protein